MPIAISQTLDFRTLFRSRYWLRTNNTLRFCKYRQTVLQDAAEFLRAAIVNVCCLLETASAGRTGVSYIC